MTSKRLGQAFALTATLWCIPAKSIDYAGAEPRGIAASPIQPVDQNQIELEQVLLRVGYLEPVIDGCKVHVFRPQESDGYLDGLAWSGYERYFDISQFDPRSSNTISKSPGGAYGISFYLLEWPELEATWIDFMVWLGSEGVERDYALHPGRYREILPRIEAELQRRFGPLGFTDRQTNRTEVGPITTVYLDLSRFFFATEAHAELFVSGIRHHAERHDCWTTEI